MDTDDLATIINDLQGLSLSLREDERATPGYNDLQLAADAAQAAKAGAVADELDPLIARLVQVHGAVERGKLKLERQRRAFNELRELENELEHYASGGD